MKKGTDHGRQACRGADAIGNVRTFPEVEPTAAHALGATMLRRELLVEVEHDHIVVRVTGTSYAVSYFRMDNSTGLVARNLPSRDDHRAPATSNFRRVTVLIWSWSNERRSCSSPQFTQKPIATPHLIPMKQTSDDLELLARAWRAANDKARELGWIV